MIIIGLSIEEQEVVMTGLRNEDFFELYASDTLWISKMDRLVRESEGLIECIEENEWGKTYRFPKRLLTIRRKFVTVNLSEEQRRARSERMQNMQNTKRAI